MAGVLGLSPHLKQVTCLGEAIPPGWAAASLLCTISLVPFPACHCDLELAVCLLACPAPGRAM